MGKNSRVVNPCMAIVAAVTVGCVIGPFIVVRGDVTADNAPYWCNRITIEPEDTESIIYVDDLLHHLVDLPLSPPVDIRGGDFYMGVPTNGCCFLPSCKTSWRDFNTSTGKQTSPFCSHASCNDHVQHHDCAQCVYKATVALREACKTSIGGQIQLQGCRVRYEAYGFVE